jgi:hypothetical protein
MERLGGRRNRINLHQQLAIDVQYILEISTGHVKLQWTDNGEVIPVEFLDAVETFVNVPSNLIRNHRIRHPEEQLPTFNCTI